MSGLGRKKIDALVDHIRRNFLYQSPQAVFSQDAEGNDKEVPDYVTLKIKPGSYVAIMQLIQEHGGWDLTHEQKAEVSQKHDAVAKALYESEDLSNFSTGDLTKAWEDSFGIEELAVMRGNIGAELAARNRPASQH